MTDGKTQITICQSCKKADHLDEKTDFKPPPEFTYYTKTMMLEQVILDRCSEYLEVDYASTHYIHSLRTIGGRHCFIVGIVQ